jgi:TetR/AcrR family transcriptional regulator, regulator of autoinduction and epiphytic fitness
VGSLINASTSVKARTYRSPRRAAQARETRRLVLDVAARLFAERGYVGTSFDAVAAEAGVGRATVFAHFPTKSALLKAAYDVTLVGDDEPVALPDRPESLAVRAEPDPARFLDGYAGIVTGVGRRLSPIYEAIRGAAHADPEAANVWRTINDERRLGGRNVVAGIVGRNALRPGRDRGAAADVVYALADPGLYHLLVRQCGWTHKAYTAWLAEALKRELLGEPR